ncbi:MAG TPA: isochorismatase family protein, partial [Candidatus Kryptobacter bacterium]|nr:isochorismatase family protein [Candidatus Kryptobacter bacterium]
IDNSKYPGGHLKEMLAVHRGEVIFRKQRFDVFTNPNIGEFLGILRPTDVVVYGVALDVCDAHAIEGFLRLGSYNLYLVEDAVKAIYEEKGKELLEEWSRRGVTMIKTADVENGFAPRSKAS